LKRDRLAQNEREGRGLIPEIDFVGRSVGSGGGGFDRRRDLRGGNRIGMVDISDKQP